MRQHYNKTQNHGHCWRIINIMTIHCHSNQISETVFHVWRRQIGLRPSLLENFCLSAAPCHPRMASDTLLLSHPSCRSAPTNHSTQIEYQIGLWFSRVRYEKLLIWFTMYDKWQYWQIPVVQRSFCWTWFVTNVLFAPERRDWSHQYCLCCVSWFPLTLYDFETVMAHKLNSKFLM